jgi:hypothetical protein
MCVLRWYSPICSFTFSHLPPHFIVPLLAAMIWKLEMGHT